MPVGRSGLFQSLEKKREEWERERSLERKKSCPMRHPENGNCLPVGGFCLDAVSAPICKAMHMAYEMGFTSGATRFQREAQKNEPLTLEQLLEMDCQPVWVEHPDGYKHYDGWTLVFVSWKAQKQVRVTYATGGSGDVSLLLDSGAKIYRRQPVKE